MTTVVHLSTVHPVTDVRIKVKECASLAEAGFDVTLIANPGPEASAPTHHHAAENGLDVIELRPAPFGRFGRVLLQPLKALAAIRRLDPAVVHFHDPELLLLAPALRAFGIRCIYDVHEDLPKQVYNKEYLPTPVRSVLAHLVRRAEPQMARLCDAVVVVDEGWSERFDRCETIPLRNFPKKTEFVGLDINRDLARVAPHFVYVGGISRIRGTEWMTRAAQLLPPDVRVSIGGVTTQAYGSTLAALDEGDRVERLGWMERQAVIELFGSALAGLVPLAPTRNYLDAVATKIFEYAHAGLPMILSDLPGHRALNDEFELGLVVDFDDDEALAAAMMELHEDRGLATYLGQNAAKAAEEFCWEVDVLALLNFYERYDK